MAVQMGIALQADTNSSRTKTAWFFAFFATMLLMASMCPAQTYTVLHTFTGQQDGAYSVSGLTLGGAGTLYGAGGSGGIYQDRCIYGCGTVYKLTLHNSNWIFSPLYNFPIAANPLGGIAIGPGGIPFGTTTGGDGQSGTVFQITPGSSFCHSVLCYWNKATVATFNDGFGSLPEFSNLSFDAAGNIYGTTYDGPYPHGGAMYKLTRSGGSWTPSLLHSFGGDTDGKRPYSNVIIDQAGNYYATTSEGGASGLGTVVQIVPGHGVYDDNILYSFSDDENGNTPWTGLTMDAQGNLFGTTRFGGSGGGGTIFELSPVGGQWQFKLLYSFTGSYGPTGGNLTMDSDGNLYGTTGGGGLFDLGMVFKLSPSNGSWTLTDLHDFTGGTGGSSPAGNVARDASGNLYGTAALGGMGGGHCGASGCGVVWEVSP